MSIKILIADDSAADRLIIKNMLSEYDLLTAKDGVETIRLLREHPDIRLLILDLFMPNMDGFQVLSELKSNARFSDLRTVILTNLEERENEIRGLKLGAVDFIRKPIQMDSLKARVGVHLELIRTQEELKRQLAMQGMTFDVVFKHAPIGIAISYSEGPASAIAGSNFKINPKFEQITGRTQDELREMGWAAITHPDDLREELKLFNRLNAGEISSYSIDKRILKPDGSTIWVHLIMAQIYLHADSKPNQIFLIQDITERKAIEKALLESERSKSVLLSHLPGLAYRCNYDREWTMQYVSDGCLRLTGYSPESLLYNRDLSYNDIIAPEYRETLWAEWERDLKLRRPFRHEYEIITAQGERKWVLEMGEGIYNDSNEVEALEGIVIDISPRKRAEQTLKYYSEHDRSTGLFNRYYLENLLTSDAGKKSAGLRSVIGINLSQAHVLTTIYGFHYTQELLKTLVEALQVHCSDKRLLCNTGDNQLVFYLKEYRGKGELLDFCKALADTLDPFMTVERIRAGIGVVEINANNELDADQLLRKLLVASEKAIDSDENIGICFYDAELERQITCEQEIKLELTQIAGAVDNGGLFLQYQPILDLKSNRICAFEALARLDCEKLGRVPPTEFIRIAEETKLIVPIGKKVIRQAFEFQKKLESLGYSEVLISINLSVIQLLESRFFGDLSEMIEDLAINPANIGFEITESVFASDHEKINMALGKLKGLSTKSKSSTCSTGAAIKSKAISSANRLTKRRQLICSKIQLKLYKKIRKQ